MEKGGGATNAMKGQERGEVEMISWCGRRSPDWQVVTKGIAPKCTLKNDGRRRIMGWAPLRRPRSRRVEDAR
jgi:hypothetical protein